MHQAQQSGTPCTKCGQNLREVPVQQSGSSQRACCTSLPTLRVDLGCSSVGILSFHAVGSMLRTTLVRCFVTQVGLLAEQPSVRLLKHIVRCYLRLSDNPRAREALRQCLPDLLRSPQFTACLKDDPTTCRCGSPSHPEACHSPCGTHAHGQHTLMWMCHACQTCNARSLM